MTPSFATTAAAPAFGTQFTAHQAIAGWHRGTGWTALSVEPCAPAPMHPASAVLHYGQSIFEGLKAIRGDHGGVHLFRPHAHASRMRRSAHRMAMPDLPVDLFLDAIAALVRRDSAAVGDEPGAALYLRPFMIAVDERLGAATPPDHFRFSVIASPVPPLPDIRIRAPMRVWVCADHVRAAPGGTGDVKTAANYAMGMRGQADALEHGCGHAVWLDAAERRWVEELGAMNLFFVHGSGTQADLVTPPLGDTVLAGITRDTVIELAGELGLPVRTERTSVDEWRRGCATGEITEVFATGTASGVQRIGQVRLAEAAWDVGDPDRAPVTEALAELLGRAYIGATHPQWCQSIAATGDGVGDLSGRSG